MTCTTNVCGTGVWTGPLPGDPDNNVSLMAVPKYGAIEVSWTYPIINSHAVAYFKVYRGANSVFEEAVELRIASGNAFLDKLAVGDLTRYYYWIRVVSTHGTEADPIGPASAVAMPLTDEILNAISGKITFELLDADLRNGIERIDLFDRNLAKEILDRVASNASLEDALEHVRSDTGEALTYALSRIAEQSSDTEALATSVTALAAGLADAQVAIVTEQTVRATEDEAMASDIQILYSGLEDNQAAIINEQTTRVNELEAIATTISGLAAQYQNNLAAVQTEQTARVDGDAALANSITSLQTQMGTDISALNSSISSIQTSLDGKASASQLNTLATTVAGQTTTIQQNSTSIDGILAKYTVKIDNNGYITGYGLMSSNNNGTPSSSFVIRADSFALVMPGYGDYTPFAIGPAGVSFTGNTAWNKVSGTGKPQDGATVGADATNLKVGVSANLLPNTEFIGGWAPHSPGWNPGGCYFNFANDPDPWHPVGVRALQTSQGPRTGGQYNTGMDVYFGGYYGTPSVPVTAGRRYEFSARLASHHCDSALGIGWFRADNTHISSVDSGWVVRRSGGNALGANSYGDGFEHVAVFGVAPAGAAYACPYWQRSETDLGQDNSHAWLCQPFFGEAQVTQTTPSSYIPGYAKGAMSSIDRLTAYNIATYMDNAVINTALIGDAQVGTLKIAGEAVTVPRSAYTAAEITSTFGFTTFIDVQTCYIDAAGAPVMILGCASMWINAGVPKFGLRIVSPSGAILSESFSQPADNASGTAAESMFIGAVSNEVGTYKLQARTGNTFHGTSVSNRFLSLLATKR